MRSIPSVLVTSVFPICFRIAILLRGGHKFLDVKGVCVPVLTCKLALQRSHILMECCGIDIKSAIRQQNPAWMSLMSMTSELRFPEEDFIASNSQKARFPPLLRQSPLQLPCAGNVSEVALP